MAILKIGETEVEIENLSEEVKANIASLQFIDAELTRLKLTEAALQTAKIAYSNAVRKAVVDGSEVGTLSSDTGDDGGNITFD